MRRVIRILLWTFAVVVLVIFIGWWAARPAAPDAFYAAPGSIPDKPGVLLRQENFERKVPPNARAWRILYTTTRADGAPTLASAIVMTSSQSLNQSSNQSSNEPRPIIAWTHGTTGVVPSCGPSLLPEPFQYVPALDKLIEHNWIYVATDYSGQGAEGQNPYVIGEGEARSALDAVRAARQLEAIHANNRTVVWGHSQGGHAALWTGIVAPTYAPDVPIAGVVGIAPATDLPGLTDRIQHTTIGHVMTSFMLQAFSNAYSDVKVDDYTSGWKRLVARDIASRCLADWRALYSVAEAQTVSDTIFKTSPTTGALGKRLAENSPTKPITQPVMIAQGSSDELVFPDIQSQFVKQRCSAGQVIEYHRYDGLDHIAIVAPTSPLNEKLVQWTEDRINDRPFLSECREESHGVASAK